MHHGHRGEEDKRETLTSAAVYVTLL